MSTNPYQTPEGQLTNDDFAYGEVKFFSPSSRINRLRYWAHSMLFTFVSLGLYILVAIVASFVSMYVGIALGIVVFLATVVFSYILMIQRLHDLNKTGWMSLLMLVPFANIYLMVILIFFKGTEGRNNYGLQTPPNKTWHWILAFSMPVFAAVLGILAAVALPAYQNYVERVQGVDSSYTSPDADQSEYQEDGAVGEEPGYSDEAVDESASYEDSEAEITEEEALDAAAAELLEQAESTEADSTEVEGTETEATEATETSQ